MFEFIPNSWETMVPEFLSALHACHTIFPGKMIIFKEDTLTHHPIYRSPNEQINQYTDYPIYKSLNKNITQ